jgi:hypothetical protein
MTMEGSIDDARRLDGNAAAGVLREVFAVEVTTARATCAGCGQTRVVAELMLYGGEIGTILRCPVCDHPVIRLARTPAGYSLDLRGAAVLRLEAVRE